MSAGKVARTRHYNFVLFNREAKTTRAALVNEKKSAIKAIYWNVYTYSCWSDVIARVTFVCLHCMFISAN